MFQHFSTKSLATASAAYVQLLQDETFFHTEKITENLFT